MVVGLCILSNKVVFLDRDGVINVRALPHEYIKEWEEFKFLPLVAESIALLNKHGYMVIVVTNQRGIARGHMTIENVSQIHDKMRESLFIKGAKITDVFVCPHNKDECHCRKPEIGLFIQAATKYEIDKTASYMVGDSITDVQAGEKYGVKTIALGKEDFNADYKCDNLWQAASWIIREKKK